MNSKKPYLPNDWDGVMNTEITDGIDYETFMTFRVDNWYINSSHNYLIRAESKKTGKIKEFSYIRGGAATNKILALLSTDHHVILADHDSISEVSVRPPTL